MNIFDKDYVFIPINEKNHWYLAVLCFPGLEDSSIKSNLQIKPIILIFDSMKQSTYDKTFNNIIL